MPDARWTCRIALGSFFVRDSSDTKGSIAVARQNKRSMKVHWITFGVGWLAIGSARGGLALLPTTRSHVRPADGRSMSQSSSSPVLTSLGEWALSCSGEAHDRDCQVVQADCGTRRLRFHSLQQPNLAAVDCAARFSRSRSWRLFARQRRWSGFSSYSRASLLPGK